MSATNFSYFIVIFFLAVPACEAVDQAAPKCESYSSEIDHAACLAGSGLHRDALLIYKKLSKQGDVRAHAALSEMYEFGHGVEQNADEAILFSKKAFYGGLHNQSFALGMMYLTLKKDVVQAIQWLQIAAIEGNTAAPHLLAKLHYDGVRDQADWCMAHYWFSKISGNLDKEESERLRISKNKCRL